MLLIPCADAFLLHCFQSCLLTVSVHYQHCLVHILAALSTNALDIIWCLCACQVAPPAGPTGWTSGWSHWLDLGADFWNCATSHQRHPTTARQCSVSKELIITVIIIAIINMHLTMYVIRTVKNLSLVNHLRTAMRKKVRRVLYSLSHSIFIYYSVCICNRIGIGIFSSDISVSFNFLQSYSLFRCFPIPNSLSFFDLRLHLSLLIWWISRSNELLINLI